MDLTPHFNQNFAGCGLAEHFRGTNQTPLVRSLSGVEFDLRAGIHLNCPAVPRDLDRPAEVRNIRVKQRCRALHFPHAVGWGKQPPDGTQIGSYVIHYTDGQHEIALRYAEDLRLMADLTPGLKRATEAVTQR